MSPGDPFPLARLLATVLERLGVRYVIGGSVASSIHGEPRASVDLDLMIDVDEEGVRFLVEELRERFYVDEEDARDAVRTESSFNVIHYDTAMKVDFFIAESAPFARKQLERRQAIGGLHYYTPEDLVVRKLMWYRLGNEVSEKQWRDIVGILKVSGTKMDREYLNLAAAEVGVEGLLARAAREAGT